MAVLEDRVASSCLCTPRWTDFLSHTFWHSDHKKHKFQLLHFPTIKFIQFAANWLFFSCMVKCRAFCMNLKVSITKWMYFSFPHISNSLPLWTEIWQHGGIIHLSVRCTFMETPDVSVHSVGVCHVFASTRRMSSGGHYSPSRVATRPKGQSTTHMMQQRHLQAWHLQNITISPFVEFSNGYNKRLLASVLFVLTMHLKTIVWLFITRTARQLVLWTK